MVLERLILKSAFSEMRSLSTTSSSFSGSIPPNFRLPFGICMPVSIHRTKHQEKSKIPTKATQIFWIREFLQNLHSCVSIKTQAKTSLQISKARPTCSETHRKS